MTSFKGIRLILAEYINMMPSYNTMYDNIEIVNANISKLCSGMPIASSVKTRDIINRIRPY
jgi:hypothetical protein